MAAFGVTKDNKDVEWFDIVAEAVKAHHAKPGSYEWIILIYAFSERIGTINYNPRHGYFITGYVDGDGVDLIEKYGLKEQVYAEIEL